MYILAMETTGPFASCAVINEQEKVLASITGDKTLSHLSDLIPMIDRCLLEAGLKKKDLTHIAVSCGPGSFTGIRIGVSTARALGQALELPMAAVPSLNAFLNKKGAFHEPGEAVICVLFNARRGQVYGFVENLLEAGPYMLEDVLAVLKEKLQGETVLFYGDGIDAYEARIKEFMEEAGLKYRFADKPDRYQDAEQVAKSALHSILSGQVLSFEQVLPDYMRQAEAEQKLKSGQLPICNLPKQE